MIAVGQAGNFDGTLYDNAETGARPSYDPNGPSQSYGGPNITNILKPAAPSVISFELTHPNFSAQTHSGDTLAIAPRAAAIPTPSPIAAVTASIASLLPASFTPQPGAVITGVSTSGGNTFVDQVAAPAPAATTTPTATDVGTSGGANSPVDSTTKTLLQFLASTLGNPQPVQSSLAPVNFAPMDSGAAVGGAAAPINKSGLVVMLLIFAVIGGGGYYWYSHRG